MAKEMTARQRAALKYLVGESEWLTIAKHRYEEALELAESSGLSKNVIARHDPNVSRRTLARREARRRAAESA